MSGLSGTKATAIDRDAARFVESSAWAKCLTDAELDRCLAAVRLRQIAAHVPIVVAGTPATHWIGVMNGLLMQSVSAPSGRVCCLTAVEGPFWFGEGSLMENDCWRYDMTPLRESRVVLLPRATFEWLRERSLPFNRYLSRVLNERLGLYMGLLANERLMNLDERTARVIASLFDPAIYPNRNMRIALTQQEVAQLAGISRQRANATLKRLESAGLLRLERGGMTVLDVEGLRRYESTTPSEVDAANRRA